MGCINSKFYVEATTAGVSGGSAASMGHVAEDLLSQLETVSRLVPELHQSFAGVHANLNHVQLKISLSHNPKLLRYMKAFITNAATAVRFLASLRRCLHEARRNMTSLGEAISFFAKKDYAQTLAKMNEFAAAGDPFIGLIAGEQQTAVEEKNVGVRRKRLERKLSSVKVSRKVWKVASNVALVLVLASAVIMTALGMPPVASTSAFAAVTVIKSAEQWLDAILNGVEEALEGEKEVLRLAGDDGTVVMYGLDTIRVLVDRMEIELESLSRDVVFVVEEEDGVAVGVSMRGVWKKMKAVEKMMNELEKEVDRCDGGIRGAVARFVNAVIER